MCVIRYYPYSNDVHYVLYKNPNSVVLLLIVFHFLSSVVTVVCPSLFIPAN